MASLCLHYLTVPDVDPVGRVALAAAAGFDAVSVRLLPPAPDQPAMPLLADEALARRVASAARDARVRVDEVDLARLPLDADGDVLPRLVDRAASLGARHVVAVGQADDAARTAAGFARLCQLAAVHGISAHLEPISWNPVRTLAQAAAILRAADQPNAGILVDALHFHRMGESLAELAALPPGWLRLCHLCDAPAGFDPAPDALRREARTARLLPGEGELPLAALLATLPRDITLSVEVPSQGMLALPPRVRADRALAAARRVLG